MYKRQLQLWEHVILCHPEAVTVRTQKTAASLRALLSAFPRTHAAAAAVDVVAALEQIRAKFRQLCAGLPTARPSASASASASVTAPSPLLPGPGGPASSTGAVRARGLSEPW